MPNPFVFVSLILVLLAFAASALDVYLRVYQDLNSLIAFAASCAFLAVGALLILSSRRIYIKSALADIPKLFVPINEGDIPKHVHKLIHGSLARAAAMSLEARPRISDANPVGWGMPGSPFDGINFQKSILQTFELLVGKIQPDLEYRMSVKEFVQVLVQQERIDAELAFAYANRYESIQFGNENLLEKDFVDFMKLFTLVLKR